MPDESHFKDFAKFVADFIERYQSSPAWSGYVEIWNEPNFGDEAYCGDIEPGKFAAMLKAVNDELEARGLRNNVKIILGGLGPTGNPNMVDFDFLDALYSADPNVGRYYDILGYHPYGEWNDYECKCGSGRSDICDPGTLNGNGRDCWAFDRMRKIHDLLASKGDGNKKIMITEFSWRQSEYNSPLNKEKIGVDKWQMKNVAEAYANMFKDYPFLEKPACYWVLSGTDQWKDTGDLLNPDKSKRPIYYCLKNLLGNCDDESMTKAPLCPCNTK